MSDNDKRVSNPADIPVLDEVLVPGKPAEAAPVPDDDLDDLLDECADELGDEFDISDDLPDDAPAEDTLLGSAQVMARREVLARAPQDDDPNVVIGLGRSEGVVEFLEEPA